MERSNGRAGPPARAQSIRHATHGRIGRAALRRDGGRESAEHTERTEQAERKTGKTLKVSVSSVPSLRILMKTEKQRSKPIRVLIVAAPPDWIGGQAVQAARLLEGLAREPGVEAELLPIRPRLPGALQLLREIKYVRTVVYTIAYVALLLLRLPRFDVAHVFAASYFSFVIAPAPAVLIAKLYGTPVLLNYHGGEAEDHLRRWPRSTRLIFRLADRVVTPSRYLVGVFARFGIEAEAVSNTAPLERFAFRERRPLRPTLLSNRSLESHYNVGDTLRAFALVERRVPDARLIVAGDGNERARLHVLAAELGLKRVEFVGAAPPDRMPELYGRADIFVNSSLVDNRSEEHTSELQSLRHLVCRL